jgi:hypothetical protein
MKGIQVFDLTTIPADRPELSVVMTVLAGTELKCRPNIRYLKDE